MLKKEEGKNVSLTVTKSPALTKSSSPVPKLTKPPSLTLKAGEGGNHLSVTNFEFMTAVFHQLPAGVSPAVCSKGGDPTNGGWHAVQANEGMDELIVSNNNYISCSSFVRSDDDGFNVRKENFAAYHCLMLDDLGTKVAMDKLGNFKLSWLIETSPGNFQGGIILAAPITDVEEAEGLQKALLSAGLGDEGASGVSRWARLPVAINGKEKYRKDGNPFQCRLVEWRPEKRYMPQEIIDGLKLKLTSKKEVESSVDGHGQLEFDGDDVFTPRFDENPVITALKNRGLYKTPLGSAKHDITCPWVEEHTDELDSGTAYFEPDEEYPVGGFVCMHSHREKYRTREFFEFLGIELSQAKNKPTINVIAGDLHRVVSAAERELARRGKHFQAGGLIVSIVTDTNTGDPVIIPTNKQALTCELSMAASWERYDGRTQSMVPTDPPQRHTGILYDLGRFRYLPTLKGLARQPFYRESDGVLVTKSGYDQDSKLFGVFDPNQYVMPEPTLDAAREALALLRNLLDEFHFASDL